MYTHNFTLCTYAYYIVHAYMDNTDISFKKQQQRASVFKCTPINSEAWVTITNRELWTIAIYVYIHTTFCIWVALYWLGWYKGKPFLRATCDIWKVSGTYSFNLNKVSYRICISSAVIVLHTYSCNIQGTKKQSGLTQYWVLEIIHTTHNCNKHWVHSSTKYDKICPS